VNSWYPAFLRAVEIVGARHAELARACDDRFDQFMLRADIRTRQRTVAAVRRTGLRRCPRFGKIREHVAPTPPRLPPPAS
jgi:hypothetical protein